MDIGRDIAKKRASFRHIEISCIGTRTRSPNRLTDPKSIYTVKKPVGLMLDKPEKTLRLLKRLEAALPFEADLTSEVMLTFGKKDHPPAVQKRQTILSISYAGDDGGILCHMRPENGSRAIVASITHIRMPAHLPFATAVVEYQKHRVKKLRRLNGA